MNKDDTPYTAIIAGATGAVGAELLKFLIYSGRYSSVIALVRRPLPFKHPVLQERLSDFSDLTAIPACDHVFCCVGSTMAKAGSRDAFEAVDLEIPVKLAEASAAKGASAFLVVSAMGANADSRIFYNRVKGKMEQAVKRAGIASVRIFRPGLLMGPRAEKRAGEKFAKIIFTLLNPLLPAAWKGVPAKKVAYAMFWEAMHLTPGDRIIGNAEIIKMPSAGMDSINANQ